MPRLATFHAVSLSAILLNACGPPPRKAPEPVFVIPKAPASNTASRPLTASDAIDAFIDALLARNDEATAAAVIQLGRAGDDIPCEMRPRASYVLAPVKSPYVVLTGCAGAVAVTPEGVPIAAVRTERILRQHPLQRSRVLFERTLTSSRQLVLWQPDPSAPKGAHEIVVGEVPLTEEFCHPWGWRTESVAVASHPKETNEESGSAGSWFAVRIADGSVVRKEGTLVNAPCPEGRFRALRSSWDGRKVLVNDPPHLRVVALDGTPSFDLPAKCSTGEAAFFDVDHGNIVAQVRVDRALTEEERRQFPRSYSFPTPVPTTILDHMRWCEFRPDGSLVRAFDLPATFTKFPLLDDSVQLRVDGHEAEFLLPDGDAILQLSDSATHVLRLSRKTGALRKVPKPAEPDGGPVEETAYMPYCLVGGFPIPSQFCGPHARGR